MSNHKVAVAILDRLRSGRDGEVRFVSPIVSACLAVHLLENETHSARVLLMTPHAKDYSRINGLRSVIDGSTEPQPQTGALCGLSYTPLVSLVNHAEVNSCNQRINSVIRTCLREYPRPIINALCKSVGELHDNVAAHADGRGYSAAQVFDRRIELAIADFGVGLLHNAKKVGAATSEAQAIEWACERGTTSVVDDEWRQRGVDADPDEDHGPDGAHLGLGLWQLRTLVDIAGGTLWLGTGKTSRTFSNGHWSGTERGPFVDRGLAIEVDMPLDVEEAKLRNIWNTDVSDTLAEELGL